MKKNFIKCVLVSVSLSLGVSGYAMHPGGNPDGTGRCGKCFEVATGTVMVGVRIVMAAIEHWWHRVYIPLAYERGWEDASIEAIRELIAGERPLHPENWRNRLGMNGWRIIARRGGLEDLMNLIMKIEFEGEDSIPGLLQRNGFGDTLFRLELENKRLSTVLLLLSLTNEGELQGVLHDENNGIFYDIVNHFIEWMGDEVMDGELTAQAFLEQLITWLENEGRPQKPGQIRILHRLRNVLEQFRRYIQGMPEGVNEIELREHAIEWINQALESLNAIVVVAPQGLKSAKGYRDGSGGGDGCKKDE